MDPRRGFGAYDNQMQFGISVPERVPFSLDGRGETSQHAPPPDTDRDVN